MSVSQKKHERLVVPGERLGVIEEYNPGLGTYVHGGIIKAKTIGYATLDRENKKINVFQRARIPLLPKKGLSAVGEIQLVQDKLAQVKLVKIGKSEIKNPFSAILHVSYASKQFLKSLREAFKPGDIIYAEIIGDENLPCQLSTAEKDFGVIRSFCSQCGGSLNLIRRQLTCSVCGSVERRKISDKYGEDV